MTFEEYFGGQAKTLCVVPRILMYKKKKYEETYFCEDW